MEKPRHKYICIEGNIGAGKTTLTRLLSREWQAIPVYEQFTDNPFLPLFYNNPERYAFQVELFFMTERHKQLQDAAPLNNLFDECVIADYFFNKSILFASHTLGDSEYRLFKRLHNILSATAPDPELLVYLHRSVDRIYEQIQKRDRNIEKSIGKDYLEKIQGAYFEYFKHELHFPILILDVEDLDFEHKRADYDLLREWVSKRYAPGVHRVRLVQ